MPEDSGEIILVLDDEPHIAQAIQMLLETRGYRVVTASGCDEALTHIESGRTRLLLADVNMPCMNGFHFVQQLQRDGLLKNMPVIFVSAMARVKDIQVGLSVGACDYLTKPFDPVELIERVEKALQAA